MVPTDIPSVTQMFMPLAVVRVVAMSLYKFEPRAICQIHKTGELRELQYSALGHRAGGHRSYCIPRLGRTGNPGAIQGRFADNRRWLRQASS